MIGTYQTYVCYVNDEFPVILLTPSGWISFAFIFDRAPFTVLKFYQEGLLGIPHMQISGNGSSSFLLHWTQDRIGPDMPQPWVLTVPIWVFRVLMLLRAFWLAYSLLK